MPNLLTVHRKRGIGGFLKKNAGIIGTGLGAGLGALAGNPMLGAQIGGAAGSLVEGTLAEEEGQPRRVQPTLLPVPGFGGTAASQGFSFRRGGLLTIGQDASRITGPSHEEGGVQIDGGAEVEGGETLDFVVEGGRVRRPGEKTPYVFSRRLKVPGSEKSFADYHATLVKRGAGDEEIQNLARIQESVNGHSSANTLAAGGTAGPDPVFNVDLETMPAAPAEGAGGTGAQLLSFGQKLLPYAGDLLNLGRGALGSSDLPEAPRMTVPRTAIQAARRMPTDVNVRPQLAAVQQSTRTLMASPGATPQQKLAAHSKSLRERSRILARKENREHQREAKKQQAIANLTGQLDSQQAAANHRAALRQQQNQLQADAAKSQLLSAGLAGLSRTYQQQQASKGRSDTQMMAVMAQLAGKDPAVRESVVRSLLPMVKNEQTRRQLLQFIGP